MADDKKGGYWVMGGGEGGGGEGLPFEMEGLHYGITCTVPTL